MRNILITLFTLLACATCFGQSSFQGITPGASTRNDVTSVLGQPVRSISATVFEYKPPAGIAKFEVEYESGGRDPIIKRIEVYLSRPVFRPALMQKFNLPQQSDTKIANADGNLVEYFSGAELLAFTYATENESGGVTSIGYYSRELFASVTGLRSNLPAPVGPTPGDSSPASPKPSTPTNVRAIVIPDGTRLTAVTTEKISSKSAAVGDPVILKVADPAIVGGRVVVEKGTTVKGTIVTVEKNLAFKVESTTATDGQEIKLRAAKNKGDQTVFHTVSLTPLFAPFGISMAGGEPSIKRGLKLKVYTDEEKRVLVKD